MADLNSLVIFAAVAEAKSFSEASRKLKMPVSTVSRRIAELESELGMHLLNRSTRSLRLTETGGEVLEYARRGAEISTSVDNMASSRRSKLSGVLRLSAPPSISESLVMPIVEAFQASHPEVSVHILITERMVRQVEEGIDMVFRFGELEDSALVARKVLTYRHQLVASPAYIERQRAPTGPQELLNHRLLAFSRWRPDNRWSFLHVDQQRKETLTFRPYVAINDYSGIAFTLLAGRGIGELPPLVQPELLREGRLVEVMPDWRFRTFDLSIVHLGERHVPKAVKLFKEFAAEMALKLFPALPR